MPNATVQNLRQISPGLERFLALERELEGSIAREIEERRIKAEEAKKAKEKKARRKRLKRRTAAAE